MKLIISGGGTGGHIYPAIALIQEFQRRDKDIEILYVGAKNGMEGNLIPEMGIAYKEIRVKGLPRKINKNFFLAIKELGIGIKQSKEIIKEFQPTIAIGTGGYVCGPILYAAAKGKIKTLIHEQNSYPGITNRILSRYVDKVAITFESSKKYFKHPEKIVLTGNPIRSNLKGTASQEDYDFFNINSERPVIFSFGGSNGFTSLNRAMIELIPLIKNEVQIIHVTGKNHYDDFIKTLGEENLTENVKIYPYMNNMAAAYAVSDVVIACSGAITLAEISQLGLPSILLPKAYTTENHQEFNAQSYVNAGASEMILEKELNGKILYEHIVGLVYNEEKMKEMALNSRKMNNSDASSHIVDLAYKLIDQPVVTENV